MGIQSESATGVVKVSSTNLVHTGTQSLLLQTTNPYAQGQWASIQHTFRAPVYGSFSVWVYDTMVLATFSDYLQFEVRNSTTGQQALIFTQNYDQGVGGFGHNYFCEAAGVQSRTSIARSSAWHHWVIAALPDSLTLSIDGSVVYQGAGGMSFDMVTVLLSGGTHPSFAVPVDDFEFRIFPEQINLTVRVSQVDVCWNSRSNETYQVQYRSDLKISSVGPLPAGHFEQKLFAVFAPTFGRWEDGRRPLDFNRNSRPVCRQFSCEKKLGNSLLKMPVGTARFFALFLAKNWREFSLKKAYQLAASRSRIQQQLFSGEFWRKFGLTFDQNSEDCQWCQKFLPG